MNRWIHRPTARFWCGRFWCGIVALFLSLGITATPVRAQSFPQYGHVFLLIMKNENYNQVIGNTNSPILNALAQNYALAPHYRGVGDPSEPTYVAMLGAEFFGIKSDEPYWFPGQ